MGAINSSNVFTSILGTVSVVKYLSFSVEISSHCIYCVKMAKMTYPYGSQETSSNDDLSLRVSRDKCKDDLSLRVSRDKK